MTPGGEFDEFWGHDPSTGEDRCAESYKVHAECLSKLSVEEYCAKTANDPNPSCEAETKAMSRCRAEYRRAK